MIPQLPSPHRGLGQGQRGRGLIGMARPAPSAPSVESASLRAPVASWPGCRCLVALASPLAAPRSAAAVPGPCPPPPPAPAPAPPGGVLPLRARARDPRPGGSGPRLRRPVPDHRRDLRSLGQGGAQERGTRTPRQAPRQRPLRCPSARDDQGGDGLSHQQRLGDRRSRAAGHLRQRSNREAALRPHPRRAVPPPPGIPEVPARQRPDDRRPAAAGAPEHPLGSIPAARHRLGQGRRRRSSAR